MGMLTRRTATGALALTLALGAVACSDDTNEVSAPSFASTPTALTDASTTVAVSTTTEAVEPSTTVVATTTIDSVSETTVASTVDDGLTGPMFSDALGVKVATAPGVNTRGDTRQLLPEGLYVHLAWEADPNDPSVFTAQPDDVEILEAYANASLAFYRAATTDLEIDSEEFEPYMTDAGAQFAASLEAAAAEGYVDTLGSGVVLRPYLVADAGSSDKAVVLDCTLSNEQFVLRGEAPSDPTVVQRGQAATMVKVGGVWKVDTFSEQGRACI
jgi:hypothetical protein